MRPQASRLSYRRLLSYSRVGHAEARPAGTADQHGTWSCRTSSGAPEHLVVGLRRPCTAARTSADLPMPGSPSMSTDPP
jgi:hypothetical protein